MSNKYQQFSHVAAIVTVAAPEPVLKHAKEPCQHRNEVMDGLPRFYRAPIWCPDCGVMYLVNSVTGEVSHPNRGWVRKEK